MAETSSTLRQEIKLFYCYAHEDKALRDELQVNLAGLRRQYQLTHWYDREILPGEQWEEVIDTHLSTADVILLLISPHFVDSEYCYSKEMQRALARHSTGDCCVIPILLRPTYWEDTPFSTIQMLPTDARPITSWPDRYEAFHDVAKNISTTIKALITSRQERAREEQQRKAEEEQPEIISIAGEENGFRSSSEDRNRQTSEVEEIANVSERAQEVESFLSPVEQTEDAKKRDSSSSASNLTLSEQEPYFQDYEMARRIREAAQEGTSSWASNPALDEQEPNSVFPPSRFSTPPEPIHANPFEDDIEEFSPSFLPTQRGFTYSPDVHNIPPDVADIPMDIHKIEDIEEPDNSQDFPLRQWDNEFLNQMDDSFSIPAIDTGTRSGRRSGKLPRSYDEDDLDFLPPADQSTLVRPNRPSSSGSLSARRAGNRPVQSRPLTRSRIPAALPPPRRTPHQSADRQGRLITIAVIVALILLLLIVFIGIHL